MAGRLSIVATPIGNLGDITLRALETLKAADVIACEDTRTAGLLLKHFSIPKKPFVSLYDDNEEFRIPHIVALVRGGQHVALISESGTPLISDPGFKVVRELVKEDLKVESIPGPSALINALVVSGLPTNAFVFLGFLPKKEGKARAILEGLKTSSADLELVKTAVFYESPHRIVKTLDLVSEVLDDPTVVVAREMTKVHENTLRGRASEVREQLENVKGEVVLLVELNK